MIDWALLGDWTAIASGAALSVLGLLLAAPRSRRDHTRLFGVFLVVWSGVIVFGNLSSVAVGAGDRAAALTWLNLHVPLIVVAYVPLACFAATYPAEPRPLARRPALLAALIAPAAIGIALYGLAPDLFHQGLVGEPPNVYSVWGPAYILFSLLFSAAFYYTVLVLQSNFRDADSDLEQRRSLYVLLALLLYVGYRAGHSLVLFGDPVLAGRSATQLQATAFVADAAVGVAVTVYAGWRLLAARARLRDRQAPVAAAVAAPVLFGLVSAQTSLVAELPTIQTLGLLRFASVALIGYAILRFELFDVDEKVQRALVAAGLLTVAAVGAVAVEQLLETVFAPTTALLVSQAVLFGGVVVAVLAAPRTLTRTADRLFDGPTASSLEERRLEVYEAALMQSAARGDVDDDPELADLRDELGISDLEHEVLRGVALGGPRRDRDEPTALSPGDMLADRYHLAEVVDEGAIGTTYEAWDRTLDRRVAVKTISDPGLGDDETARTFLREARLAARIEHPNVVRVYDFGYEGGTPYIVMEHVDGGTLDEIADGPLPPAEAVGYVEGILDGLSAIHDAGVLHRDLKPANVVVAGEAKIADFGIAVRPDADRTATGLPEPSETAGTPAYLAPEVLQGGEPTTGSEVYAAGAVLYELLAGRPYLDFDGRTLTEIRRVVAEEAPDPLPDDVPDELVAVVETALAKDPDDRYASAAAMAEALAGVDVTRRGTREATGRPR